MEPLFIALLVAFLLAGAVIRRWTAVALPLTSWPLFYFGLEEGWWGYGLGDGWLDVAVWALVVGLVSTALAVGLARRVNPQANVASR